MSLETSSSKTQSYAVVEIECPKCGRRRMQSYRRKQAWQRAKDKDFKIKCLTCRICKLTTLERHRLNIGVVFGDWVCLDVWRDGYKFFAKLRCKCGYVKTVPVVRLAEERTCYCNNGMHNVIPTLQVRFPDEDPITLKTVRNVYRQTRNNAAKRSLEFTLTECDILNLIFKACAYCGSTPSKEDKALSAGRGRTRLVKESHGVDRVDPAQGYTLENVASCCRLCNLMKTDLTVTEFLAHIAEIYTHSQSVNFD